MDNLSKHVVKHNLTFSKIPEDQNWKIPILCELIKLRSNIISVDNHNYPELNEMINFITSVGCTLADDNLNPCQALTIRLSIVANKILSFYFKPTK